MQTDRQIKRKVPGTNGRPSFALHFSRSNGLKRKLPSHFHKITISTMLFSCAITAPSRILSFCSTDEIASWERMAKAFPFESESFRYFQPKLLAKWKASLAFRFSLLLSSEDSIGRWPLNFYFGPQNETSPLVWSNNLHSRL